MSILFLFNVGCSSIPSNTAISPPLTSYVVLDSGGLATARTITTADQCPAILIDGISFAMTVRMPAQSLPQRPTRSSPKDSKPSLFPILTCEKTIPVGTKTISIGTTALPLPKKEIKRILVIGDTGCRLKKLDNAYQACNDPAAYPFATVAASAAKWKPDVVLHVGDYHYRENACPTGNEGCKNSSWGYGWDAWRDDFFTPAAPLLAAAPWIMVRGNHESCARAGQGWWRMMDPRPLLEKQDCNSALNDDIGDFSAPYAVSLGNGAQVIVLDTSNTLGEAIPSGDLREMKYRDMYQRVDALSQNADYNILANHHPILGFTATKQPSGKVDVLPGNLGMQSVFQEINPLLLPPKIDVLLSGHTHVWEQVSFSSPHPSQFIAGFSGTMEDTVPLPDSFPNNASPAPGAIVEHISSRINEFGFMTMERDTASHWTVKVWDRNGKQFNTCQIEGAHSQCDLDQVH